MRRMSFAITTQQVRDRSKTVTRRDGWENAQPGEHLLAIEKGMGLPKGSKHVVLDEIIVVDARRESIFCIVDEPNGCALEGFPDMTGDEFVEMYCTANGVRPSARSLHVCTRIEFRYAAPDERQWPGWIEGTCTREDQTHCVHWWDGGHPCCSCGQPGGPVEEVPGG